MSCFTAATFAFHSISHPPRIQNGVAIYDPMFPVDDEAEHDDEEAGAKKSDSEPDEESASLVKTVTRSSSNKYSVDDADEEDKYASSLRW